MSLLTPLLLAGAPAHAQAHTAYAAIAHEGLPQGQPLWPVGEGDLVLLRPEGREGLVVERRGEDLSLRWSTPLRCGEGAAPWTLPGLARRFQSAGDFATWPDRALLVDEARVSFVLAHDEGLRACVLDADSGAWLGEQDLLVSQARPGLLVSPEGRAVAALSGGSRGEPLVARVYDSGLTLTREQEITAFPAASRVVVDAMGRRVEEQRLLFGLGDDASLFMMGHPGERQVVVRRLDAAGGARTLVCDLGDGDLQSLAMVPGPSGRLHVVAMARDSLPLRSPFAGVALCALDFEAGGSVWSSVLSPEAIAAAMGPGADRINLSLLEAHTPVSLHETPGGGVLLITQLQAISTTLTTNTTSTSLEFEDMLVLSLGPEGALAWATGLDVDQTVPASAGWVQVGHEAWLTEDTLRLVLMEFVPRRWGESRAVTLRELSLADGGAAPPQTLLPLSERSDLFYLPLSTPLRDGALVLGARVANEDALALLVRVDLDEDPLPPGPLNPAPRADPDHPDGLAGELVGGLAAANAPRVGLQGIAMGGPITAVGTLGGAFLSPVLPMACLAGPALGCAGGAGLALALTAPPQVGAVTAFSPEFQAGYVSGYERGLRRRQLRWALLGAAGGAALAAVPASLVARTLAAP